VPEPTVKGERYAPGLDGLRALAVLVVVFYHLGFSWAPGGLLGVGVFFTLSGYLITDLLLDRWIEGGAPLLDFWRRRARRLLPALYVMLAVVGGWVAIYHRPLLGQARGDAWSAFLYVNNWWQIVQHSSYFARFGPTPPLQHLWSLAVEEQFYLLWPWLLLAGVALVRESPRAGGPRPRLALVTLVLAGASALEMALLYHPSLDSTRIYEGTDTRAFGLLFGAALAMIWPRRALSPGLAPPARRTLDRAGTLGLIGIVVMVWRTGEYSSFLYEGGLVLLSLATVLVIAAAAHPVTRLGRVLGIRPLRWLGVRSYGVYLWHLPVIALTTPALARPSYTRGLWQLALTIVISALSWRLVEEPVRRGALAQAWRRLRRAGVRALSMRARLAAVLATVGAGAAVALLVKITPAPLSGEQVSPAQAAPLRSPPGNGDPGGGQRISAVLSGNPARTSCRSVAHFGDSTSDGLNSPNYLPNPRWRISAQYARVGARHQVYEIHGGDSIVEALSGQQDMRALAQQLTRSGYHGCWVLALGTNDTADVAVGSNVGRAQRIARMMQVIGSEPVMWVNVRSLLSSGPYAERNMAAWNAALLHACRSHPNMRVFDWASVVKPQWFIPDGIHYGTPGYRWRARLIAEALAHAFPAGGRSSGCLVELPTPGQRPPRGSRMGRSLLTVAGELERVFR
jgi:peptidoglycan/LPS O-acetylase OafA/YrhL